MKRYFIILLILSIIFSFSGCVSQSIQEPVHFYYVRTDFRYDVPESVIASEIRESRGFRTDAHRLLEQYIDGPMSHRLKSPFPRNTEVISCVIENSTMNITLSDEFAQLTGIDLTIACGCIAQTFLNMFQVNNVKIQSETALLDGDQFITISHNNLHLKDDSLVRLKSTYNVFYSDARRRYLIASPVSVNTADQKNIVHFLISRLSVPPAGQGLLSPVPDGVQLLDADIDGKVCKVNFSSDFTSRGWRNPEAQRLCLMSIVNTLTQLEEIEHVEFYIENKILSQYRLINIPGPMSWDSRVIGPVRIGLNEFDASLYLTNGTENKLICVPTRIQQTAGVSQAEMIIRELISYESANGFYSPVPANTQLNSVVIDHNVCNIDFTPSFIYNPNRVAQALHSVIASVCALDEIDSVIVTINGERPTGDLAPLFSQTSVDSDWIYQ